MVRLQQLDTDTVTSLLGLFVEGDMGTAEERSPGLAASPSDLNSRSSRRLVVQASALSSRYSLMICPLPRRTSLTRVVNAVATCRRRPGSVLPVEHRWLAPRVTIHRRHHRQRSRILRIPCGGRRREIMRSSASSAEGAWPRFFWPMMSRWTGELPSKSWHQNSIPSLAWPSGLPERLVRPLT